MIKILDAPKHLLAVRVSGELTGEDVKTLHSKKDELLKDNDRISFYAEYDNTASYTLESILRDLYESFSQITEIPRYYRAAVVADKGWLTTLSRIEGVFFSSIDIRVFGLNESEKAMAWASEEPTPRPEPEMPDASLHFMSTSDPNVLAFTINGRLREQDFKLAAKALDAFLEREGELRVLGRMSGYTGFDLLSLIDEYLIKLKYRSVTKVAKYAVIGPKPWMRNLVELAGGMVPTEIRTFADEEEGEAWAWVGAEQSVLPE